MRAPPIAKVAIGSHFPRLIRSLNHFQNPLNQSETKLLTGAQFISRAFISHTIFQLSVVLFVFHHADGVFGVNAAPFALAATAASISGFFL